MCPGNKIQCIQHTIGAKHLAKVWWFFEEHLEASRSGLNSLRKPREENHLQPDEMLEKCARQLHKRTWVSVGYRKEAEDFFYSFFQLE